MDPAAKCAPIQAQGVEQLLPVDATHGVDALLPGAQDHTLSTLDDSMTNNQSWKAAQNQSYACKAAISHLKSEKVPNKLGDTNNEIGQYVRHGTLAPDGLLVTAGDQSTYTPVDPKTKIEFLTT